MPVQLPHECSLRFIVVTSPSIASWFPSALNPVYIARVSLPGKGSRPCIEGSRITELFVATGLNPGGL